MPVIASGAGQAGSAARSPSLNKVPKLVTT